jgi:hypothetical protein
MEKHKQLLSNFTGGVKLSKGNSLRGGPLNSSKKTSTIKAKDQLNKTTNTITRNSSTAHSGTAEMSPSSTNATALLSNMVQRPVSSSLTRRPGSR